MTSTPSIRDLHTVLIALGLAVLGAPAGAHAKVASGFALQSSAAVDKATGAVTLTAEVPAESELRGVQFKLDGYVLEAMVTAAPYRIVWSAASATNGPHTLTAEARYASGDVVESRPLTLKVVNTPGRGLYVDPDRGSDANTGLSVQAAWKTLDRANRAAQPGDTVHLRGNFVEGAGIHPHQSGTAEKPIIFARAPGETATLGEGQWDSNIWLSTSYIVVDGVAIRRDSNTQYMVVLGEGTHHNVIRNGVFHRTIIKLMRSSDNVLERNTITSCGDEKLNAGDCLNLMNGSSRNRILWNTLGNAGHMAVSVGGDRAQDADVLDNVVAHNVISSRWATPLGLSWKARRTLVEFNRISDGARNGVNWARSGIQMQASENVIRYNHVFNNAGPGLKMAAYAYQTHIIQESVGNQIYNNVFYGNGQEGISVSERDGLRVKDNLIANNIFFRNTGKLGRSIVLDHYHNATEWPAGSFNGNRFMNNIVLREPDAGGESVFMHVRRQDQGRTVHMTLARLQKTYPAEVRDNLEGDPRFVNAAKYEFALRPDSPALGKGLVIPGARPNGKAPDIGAPEVDTPERPGR